MELLSLLKSSRGGGGVTASADSRTTTIATTVLCDDIDDEDCGGDCKDEGPFFDLEFPLPAHEEEERREKLHFPSDAESEDDEDFNSTILSERSYGSIRRDPVLSLSPSEGLFYQGSLPSLEPSSLVHSASQVENDSKPQVPAFLVKSAAKFRVLKLGFQKKKKNSSVEPNAAASPAPKAASPKDHRQNKFFVKFKVEEVPLVSLFTRDNSSRSSISSRSARLSTGDGIPTPEDKKYSKDVLQRYLSMIKPLYVRVSKRYSEKLRFSGPLSSSGAAKVRPSGDAGQVCSPEKDSPASAKSNSKCQNSQNGNIPAGLKVVCRRLRKSRSASSAVSAVRPSPPVVYRRDDSLLEQQDGIQSAIVHCKRSLNRGSESPLIRSRSDPGDERSLELTNKSDL